MKNLFAILGLGVLAAAAGVGHADDNLLWRASNQLPPLSVPAYAGQPSPFPIPLAAVEVASATTAAEDSVEANTRRARTAALQQAEKLLSSRSAVMPEMRAIAVGGSIDGPLGPRVLINNQWVGVNKQVGVRVVRSQKAVKAIETLREFDTAAADELSRRLDTYIAKNPQLTLVLQRITSTSLVFASPDGPQVVPFRVPSAYGN